MDRCPASDPSTDCSKVGTLIGRSWSGVQRWHGRRCRFIAGTAPTRFFIVAGVVFTGDPLRLPAGHFGLGHGNGAQAPDEYYVIRSANPKIQGMDGAARSHVEYLYELAAV